MDSNLVFGMLLGLTAGVLLMDSKEGKKAVQKGKEFVKDKLSEKSDK